MEDLQARFHARRQTAGLEVRGVRDLGDGAGLRGCAAHARDAVDDVDVFGRGLQEMGRDLGHLLSEALGGALDRGTQDRTAPTAAGPERVRRLVGVALMHRDVVERHTEELADELRGRRLQTLPVRSGAEVHADGAVGLDADVRGFGAVRPDHALRLDVQADAHPQEASDRELLPLPHAERVVVDHRRGLLERLGGRHVEQGDAEGQRVGELVALQHVAAPQLERIHAQLPGEAVDGLFTEVGLELPWPAIGRARARVRERRL